MGSRAHDRLDLDLDRWRVMVDNDLDAVEMTLERLDENAEKQAIRSDRTQWLLVTTAVGASVSMLFFVLAYLR